MADNKGMSKSERSTEMKTETRKAKYYCSQGHPGTPTTNCGPCDDECAALCKGEKHCSHQQDMYAKAGAR
jgi:hypothetical protein